ncbi:hypothetical protein GDO78_007051, partial [Eleutherodactylus coqui]
TLSAPKVFPLIPCCDQVNHDTPVTMGCLVTGFMPEKVNIKSEWNGSNITSGITTIGPIYSMTNELLMMSTQLTIQASQWKNGTYKCIVEHPSSGTKQDRTLRVLPCIEPEVQLLQQSQCTAGDPEDNRNSTLDLVCLISRFYPENLQVKWLVNEKEDVTAESTLPAPLRTTDGTYTARSRLSILSGQWNRGNRYSCIVTHNSTNTSTTASAKNCHDSGSSGIDIEMIPPSFEECYMEMPKIICKVHNMNNVENLEITWTRQNDGNLDFNTEDPVLGNNGKYSVTSRLNICCEEWMSGETFICTVRNQDLPSPKSKEISKNKVEDPRPPSIYVFPPAPQETALGEMVSLTCLAIGYKPVETMVKWLQQNEEVNKNKYFNTTPIKKEDGTYFIYSYLSVPAMDWKQGDIFTCVVGHEALPYRISQQSIDKSSGKTSNVNVSLVLSDSSTCF